MEHVIVLHGLALNRWWMAGIARFLRREGYRTHDISYPSRAMTLDGLVDAHIAPLVERVPAQKAHFVAHSMGGLLVRLYARKYGTDRIGRVVMIGTPNRGSEVADLLRGLAPFRWYFGAAGQSLGARGDFCAGLGPVPFECGVIAGTLRWLHYPLCGIARVPLPNDGIVSVESTKVEGMKDHATVHAAHSLLVWDREVWGLTARFIRSGGFGNR